MTNKRGSMSMSVMRERSNLHNSMKDRKTKGIYRMDRGQAEFAGYVGNFISAL